LTEVEAAVDVVNGFRERPAGSLRLNVSVSAARVVLLGDRVEQTDLLLRRWQQAKRGAGQVVMIIGGATLCAFAA
jgi:hypothetical protein